MQEHYYAVIMAGGGGTRLWPISRKQCPKQMISFGQERSLYQMAVDRLTGVFAPEQIFIVTNAQMASALQTQVPSIPRRNYVLEPMPKGTAAAIGLAAVEILSRDDHPAATMAVLTADHYIQNVPYFRNLLLAAYDAASDGHMVTLGIKPTYPSTGYGYIQRGEWVKGYQGINAYRVVRFLEKPDEENARRLIRLGNYDWNSGMFFWRVNHILEQFRQHMPDLASVLNELLYACRKGEYSETLERVWGGIVPQTIDYGIMEKASGVVVLPTMDLGWNDVGSWDSLFEVLPPDERGNIVVDAEHIGVDTFNSLIYGEKSKRLIVTIGARNLIVVDTGDALLVCSRNEAQKVRHVIELLSKKNLERYL
ncbi:MAG: NTP transferase domain-containing protein [Anaerolineae bacterium]|nr:NTP transferase domain-containing protein [Anaerolineae bacterium]